jgi:hypothetical protein
MVNVMALPLSKFIALPKIFQDREIPKKFSVKNISEKDNGFLLEFIIKSSSSNENYTPTIWVSDEIITANTKCLFYCNCPSFKFEFESILAINNGLYGNPTSDKLPKKRQTLFVCKHLTTIIHHYLLKYRKVK